MAVLASDGDRGDPPFFIGFHAPLGGIALHVGGSIPGAALVSVVHIVSHPVVRRENVHIFSAQNFPGMINGGQIIFGSIFRIVEEFNLVLIDQIIELFLQVAYHNRNICNADSVELLNLPLNHAFPKDLQKTFWSFEGKGNKTGAEAGGHNQGSVYFIRSEVLCSLFCQ